MRECTCVCCTMCVVCTHGHVCVCACVCTRGRMHGQASITQLSSIHCKYVPHLVSPLPVLPSDHASPCLHPRQGLGTGELQWVGVACHAHLRTLVGFLLFISVHRGWRERLVLYMLYIQHTTWVRRWVWLATPTSEPSSASFSSSLYTEAGGRGCCTYNIHQLRQYERMHV